MAFPILHDYDKVLPRILEQFDVCEWIAVYQQEIRKRAFLNHAELAGIGIAFSGEGE